MVNDEISDLERQRDRYQTEVSAIRNNSQTKEGDGTGTTTQNMIDKFNEIELARATESDIYKRRSARQGFQENIKPDYSAIIADMEQGLTDANIPTTDPAWNVVAALKTKYNIQ